MAIVPANCSFDGKVLIINGNSIPFIHYTDDEIWMPAKPVMKITGETHIEHFVKRVLDGDKIYFKDLAAAKGVPLEGCTGFGVPPNPTDYNEGKAWWINESGFYKVLLSASKHKELCAKFQSWVCKDVLPSIRKTGGYGVDQVQANRLEQESIVEAVQQQYPLDVVTAASASGEPPEFVMNALSPEERSELIVARKKILADRIEAAKKNAEAERIEAEAKEVAVIRRSIFEKEADERRAKLEKEADERKAAQDKAIMRDENRVRAQTTREFLAKSKAAELASIEECRRLCPDFDTRKRQLLSDNGDGTPPATRARRQKIPLKGLAKKELIKSPIPEELADDPDIVAYRAAGIPDNALPKDAEEAQMWVNLATAEKQKIAESNTHWTSTCNRPRPVLVHPSAQSLWGQPKWMWKPAERQVL